MYWFDDQKLKDFAEESSFLVLQSQKKNIQHSVSRWNQLSPTQKQYYQTKYHPITKKNLSEMRKCFTKKTPKSFSNMTHDEQCELYLVFIDQVSEILCVEQQSFLLKNLDYLKRFQYLVLEKLNHHQLIHAEHKGSRYHWYEITPKETKKHGVSRITIINLELSSDQIDVRKGEVCLIELFHTKMNNPIQQVTHNTLQNQFIEQHVLQPLHQVIHEMILTGISEEEARHVFRYYFTN